MTYGQRLTMTPITFYRSPEVPSSFVANIPPILNAIVALRPVSVYDIGVGYGKYGMLLREYLNGYEQPLYLHGCEIFENYLLKGPAQYIYNKVEVTDWLNAKPGRSCYDVVLMIDVLEHFTTGDGVQALKKALKYSDKVLVSTPLGFEQGPVNGNRHEAHLSEWPMEQFAAVGFKLRDIASCRHSVIGWVSL